MASLTIYDIKELSKEKNPYFFDKKTMKYFRQTMRDFHVKKLDNENYYIWAWSKSMFSNIKNKTERIFNTVSNDLLFIDDILRSKFNL